MVHILIKTLYIFFKIERHWIIYFIFILFFNNYTFIFFYKINYPIEIYIKSENQKIRKSENNKNNKNNLYYRYYLRIYEKLNDGHE